MEAFHWDRHFTTGIAEVDEEHRRLVQLINALGDSLIAGEAEDPAELEAVFGRLTDYARLHFRQEEELMAREGVSAAYMSQHELLHADFAQQLTVLWATRNSTQSSAEILHGFLRSWLAMHILGEDQSMARQIRAIRSGMAPDEAYRQEASHEDNATAALLLAIQVMYRVLTQQNGDLVRANHQLEARVKERTQDLAKANAALTELNSRLEVLSNSDALLGIGNRRYFDARLQTEWRRGVRVGQPLSLLMIDVDYFKRYNDLYGHPAGDLCLQAIAQAAGTPAAMKRPADLLARYGGEELVVLLPDTPEAGALAVAADIQLAIAQRQLPHAGSPVAPVVTVSIGVATMVPAAAGSARALLAAADSALYSAKGAGRNRVVAYVNRRADPDGSGQGGVS